MSTSPSPPRRRAGDAALRALAATVSGLAVALALPDAGLWPLAFVAYAPLLWVVRGQRAWTRFWLGWLSGAALHGVLFYWIYHTLVTMSGQGAAVAVAVTGLFAVASGLHQALLALVIEPLRARSRAGWAVAVPTTIVAFEFAFPHLFPYHLGNALYRVPALVQHADLGGVYLVSFTTAFVTGALLEAAARWPSGRPRARALRPLAVASVLFALSLGYGLARLGTIDAVEPTRRVRALVVQPNIDLHAKRTRGRDRIPNYEVIDKLTREHVRPHHDLVVWPEGGFPFLMVLTDADREGRGAGDLGRQFSEHLQRLVAEVGKPFFIGSLRQPSPDARLRNSATHLGPDGGLVARYDKRLLVPIGEYVPLRDTFPALARNVPGSSDMQAGEEGRLFEVAGARWLPSICYEAVLPGFTRRASLEHGEADAIVNFTNDVWFGDTSAPELHLMVQVMRAVELRVPLLRSTNTGITAYVDAAGRVVQRAPLFEPAALDVELELKALRSPYRRVGDLFLYAALAFTAALAWPRAPRPPEAS